MEYTYKINYKNNEPEFSLSKTIGYLNMTEQVENKFATAKEFSTTSEITKLRNDCYFLDKVEHPIYGVNGNVIINYKKGSKGKAIGFKNDSGTVWIYVQMYDTNEVISCNYLTFREQPTEIYGWILKSDTILK